MNSSTTQIRYDGQEKAGPDPIPLQAGPITAVLQPESGILRYVRLGDHEIVRGIYGAVRDANWNTIQPVISDLRTDVQSSSFEISFKAHCQSDPVDFVWTGLIKGDASGCITYKFEGEAKRDFERNRIGLCVLHPVTECAGAPCQVEHVDGSVEEARFPKFIAPRQPFMNMRSITYEPAPGVKAEIRFEGEVFEMEDQRNWTDASFKTYGTPLELPFPVTVAAGTTIKQFVTVSLPGTPRKILPVLLGRDPQLSISTTPILGKPPLGLGCADHGISLTDKEINRLQRLGLSHLRAELRLDTGEWKNHYDRGAHDSVQLMLPLHVALHVGENAEDQLAAFKEYYKGRPARVSLWMFHDSTSGRDSLEARINQARQALTDLSPNALFAAGTDANFAEINRRRLPPASTALPCYSITPQIHAMDNWSLVETLAVQPQTVESMQQFAPRSTVISPITLRPRGNPYATRPSQSEKDPNNSSANYDPRQASLFGAGWTLGSIARLAAAGHIHSLTYYETTGWNGLMKNASHRRPNHAWPEFEDCVFPAYHVLADLTGFERVCPTHSSHPLQTEGLTLLDARNRRRILVANLMQKAQGIKIKTGTCQARIRYLDETNVAMAMTEPEAFQALEGEMAESKSGKIALELRPFALARVDVVS